MQRSITLDVCDYTNKPLCNLYDSLSDVSGQAHDVIVHTERNGRKEIRFKIPSTCFDEEGVSENFRIAYLISDYRLRLCSVNSRGVQETDWFLLSETKVTHSNFSQEYDVTSSHISSLLSTKNLDLEFSDEYGNNVGTIEQIANTILSGTGWNIGINTCKFYEEKKFSSDPEKEKVRSFKASTKTGAFKMMTDLCELFDAKPIYHGEGVYVEDGIEKIGRTVDIVPMNPFSEDLEEGSIPMEVLMGEGVIELHYDKNIKGLTRTLSTDHLVTKLSEYGDYGDRTMCSLQEATHAVLTFTNAVSNGKEYAFSYLNSNYYFTAENNIAANNLKWSYLDYVSRSYVTDGTHVYPVYKTPKTTNHTSINYTESSETNYFPYIMDFSYYQKVGLLTDEMLEELALFQWNMPQYYIQSYKASEDLSQARNELVRVVSGNSGFLKLKIQNHNLVGGNLVLTIDKSNSDGVIYRSDYLEAKRNYFTWTAATGIKENGTAIAGRGSVIYIVNRGDPTTWQKAYVKYLGNGTDNYFYDDLGNTYLLHVKSTYPNKESFPANGTANRIYEANDTKSTYVWFDNEYRTLYAANFEYGVNKFEEPTTITLWTSEDTYQNTSEVYLFSADDIAGIFGPREDMIQSNRDAIRNSTTQGSTEKHPMEFVYNNDPAPSVGNAAESYGWYYRSYTNSFAFGKLYFCWGKDGDNGWSEVYVNPNNTNPEKVNPSTIGLKYYYSIPRMMLYVSRNGAYEAVKGTTDNDNMTSFFKTVIVGCYKQEFLSKGVNEEYYHTVTGSPVVKGNYAFKDEFNNYWMFTLESNAPVNSRIRLFTDQKHVWIDEDSNHLVTAAFYAFDSLSFPVNNELDGVTYSDGDFVNNAITDQGTKKISSHIRVYENVQYQSSLPSGTTIVFFDTNKRYLGKTTSATFTTPRNTTSIRLVSSTIPTSSHYVRVVNYNNVFFVKNVMYTLLSSNSAGERHGITYLMDEFLTRSDDVYITKYNQLKNAQNAIINAEKSLMVNLGDMFREGYKQDSKYAKGDENILYSDALDDLKEISQPEATYEIDYLDLYGSHKTGLSTDSQFDEVEWPDVDISYAAHLIDPDIGANQWAYIDVVDKCYDAPQKTKIEINTKLSMIGQQSFTDVLAKIAEVANDFTANQALYKRAAVLTGSGKLAAERLEGAILANKLYIFGGTSNWYTDEKGNIVFEDIDGGSAMMLTGRGWAIANDKTPDGDWNWRYMASGKGITADVIYTGYLSAERIEAGSISTDKLSASVGQELEISSNQALSLFATVDGYKPAGSLETSHPAPTDSYIKIAAQQGNNPAYIDIQSGGKVNIYGGSSVNIESQGALDIKGGTLSISSQGTLDIESTGVFRVNSDNFKIKNDNSVEIKGKVTALTGEIAGLTIGQNNAGTVHYLYAGSVTSPTTQANGVYVGTDGLNIAGKLMFKADGSYAKLSVDADDITIGSVTLGSALDTLDSKVGAAQATADTAQASANLKSKTIRSTKATLLANTSFVVGDLWQDTESAYGCQYICKKKYDSSFSAETFDNYWTLVGTSILGGAALNIDADAGTINLTAASTITLSAGSAINIAANKKVSITTAGTIEIGNGTSPFTIGAVANQRAYIYNGRSSISTVNVNGIYLGTDGINVGKANGAHLIVKPSAAGTAADPVVDIQGNATISYGSIGSFTINSALYTSTKSTIDADIDGVYVGSDGISLGAHPTDSDISAFKVTNAGMLSATGATISGTLDAGSGSHIGGWYVGSNYIGNATSLNVSTIGIRHYTTSNTTKVFWSGGKYNDQNETPKFYVQSNGKLYANDAEVRGTIKATSLTIGSNDTSMKLLSGFLVSNTVTDVKTAAGIVVDQDTGIVIAAGNTDAAGNAAKVGAIVLDTNGNIAISSTDVGQSESKVCITPTSITVASGGSIDLSGADVTISASQIGANGVYATQSDIDITSTGIDLTGSKHINLDVSTNSYMHMSSAGIEMKGSRINFVDSAGNSWSAFGRDDIIVLKNGGETESQVLTRMTGKHDWILIKPYYNAEIDLSTTKVVKTVSSAEGHTGTLLDRDATSQANSFGSGATWYNYKITGRINRQSGEVVSDGASFKMMLSNSSNMASPLTVDATVVVHGATIDFTIDSGHVNTNLCAEGNLVYVLLVCNYTYTNITDVKLQCTCDATTSKVPCTVYYYP